MKSLILILVLTSFTFGQPSSKACQSSYVDLVNIATSMGWHITATNKGKHNGGSKHYIGKAIDVSVRNRTEFHIAVLDEVLKNAGYGLIDERVRPKGQRVWSSPHLHLFVLQCN